MHLISFYKIIEPKDLISVDESTWMLNSLKNIIDNSNILNDYISIKYNLNNKILKIIENIEIDKGKNFFDFSTQENSEQYNTNYIEVNDDIKNMEFKKINELNNNIINKGEYDIEKIQLEVINNVPKQFSKVFLLIIEELIDLSNKKLDINKPQDVYIYYIKEIFNIITKDGRLFYVGLFFFIVSISLFFIEIT